MVQRIAFIPCLFFCSVGESAGFLQLFAYNIFFLKLGILNNMSHKSLWSPFNIKALTPGSHNLCYLERFQEDPAGKHLGHLIGRRPVEKIPPFIWWQWVLKVGTGRWKQKGIHCCDPDISSTGNTRPRVAGKWLSQTSRKCMSFYFLITSHYSLEWGRGWNTQSPLLGESISYTHLVRFLSSMSLFVFRIISRTFHVILDSTASQKKEKFGVMAWNRISSQFGMLYVAQTDRQTFAYGKNNNACNDFLTVFSSIGIYLLLEIVTGAAELHHRWNLMADK